MYTAIKEGSKMSNLIHVKNTQIVESDNRISDLMSSFISFVDASDKTIALYKKALNKFFAYLADNGIQAPKRDDILNYKSYLLEHHKPATAQTYMVAVRLFFRWTAQEDLYKNIADNIKSVKVSKLHKKDYLTANQVKEILASIDVSTIQGARDNAMFFLMVTCGLRDIEVSRANIEDLRTLGADTVLYVHGKGRTEKAEFVKITSAVEKQIRAYLKVRKASDSKEPLFTSLSNNSQGKRLSTRSISGIVKTVMVKAGFNSERLTAHSLRHTAVTLSLLAGNSLNDVRGYARHSSLDTTNIYNHTFDMLANNCAQSVTDAILN